MSTLVARRGRTSAADVRSGGKTGTVVCLFERTAHWDGVLHAAAALAAARSTGLVVDAARPANGPPSKRVDQARAVARKAGATTLVTSASGALLAGVVAPHRSPALAVATGLETVLVSEPAAAALADRGFDGNALVCGVDDSPAAPGAARTAGRLSLELGLRLHLVHVCAPSPPSVATFTPGGAVAIPPRALEHTAREAGQVVLERAERAAGVDALARLRRGPVATGLNAYAELFGAPMIVVGAPRKGPLAAALVDSAAWRLAKDAVCPVMVVPEDAVTSSS